MKTIRNITLKSAIALTLMTGNITGPSNTEFYEDDGNFHKVSVQLSSGWGWGFNKAYAACEDGQTVEDASSPDECIDVYGDPIEESSYQESSSEESSYGGGTDGGAGGGSDDGEGTPESPPDETPEECKAGVDDLVGQCKRSYKELTIGVSILCAEVSFKLAKAFCIGTTQSLLDEAYEWCEIQGEAKKERECK